MGAPRSGNPGLAYAFRATPELAIGLDVHYKAPSLRRFFSSTSRIFSLLSSPPLAPLSPAPIRASRSHWASTLFHEAFFELGRRSCLALPCPILDSPSVPPSSLSFALRP